MVVYSYIDDRPKDETENFDELIEYRTEDFKEFSDIVKELTAFRKQAKNIRGAFNLKYDEVKSLEMQLTNLDTLYEYLTDDQTWKEKVADLKAYYVEKSNYDEMKAELIRLEEQKNHIETITSEFKIQNNQGGMCSICSERSIAIFLDPCGHVSCEECMGNMVPRRGERSCPFCRGAFTTKKIYSI